MDKGGGEKKALMPAKRKFAGVKGVKSRKGEDAPRLVGEREKKTEIGKES